MRQLNAIDWGPHPVPNIDQKCPKSPDLSTGHPPAIPSRIARVPVTCSLVPSAKVVAEAMARSLVCEIDWMRLGLDFGEKLGSVRVRLAWIR